MGITLSDKVGQGLSWTVKPVRVWECPGLGPEPPVATRCTLSQCFKQTPPLPQLLSPPSSTPAAPLLASQVPFLTFSVYLPPSRQSNPYQTQIRSLHCTTLFKAFR